MNLATALPPFRHFRSARIPGKRAGARALAALLLAALLTAVPGDGVALAADESPAVPASEDPVVDKKTEAIIKGALEWLASKQNPDGSWHSSDEEKNHPVAITAYTLLGFMAAGHLPGEGEFGRHVNSGLQYLLDAVSPDGLIGNQQDGQYMYGHGIASIALAELYGATRSPAIRGKLDRVIKIILASQNNEGGWRYRPIARDADVSVTVLQVVALRAAKNGGIDVPQTVIDNAVKYVKSCYHSSSGGFAYQPNREPGFARTAAAIYSLQVCGMYDDEMVRKGSEYLIKNNKDRDQWFTYGNFYAAPAQYMIGGETWRKWYAEIKGILLKALISKEPQYYWDSRLDQGRAVGPIYTTAVYTMILAMPLHYVPLYQR